MPAREIAALYNSPKPRQEWVDGQFIQNSEDEEAWVELFIDLVYVVLLSKIGDLMETCMHEDPFYGFKLAVIFAVMCLARQSIDEYANRFYSHDLAHRQELFHSKTPFLGLRPVCFYSKTPFQVCGLSAFLVRLTLTYVRRLSSLRDQSTVPLLSQYNIYQGVDAVEPTSHREHTR
jgi:hypothetical protein